MLSHNDFDLIARARAVVVDWSSGLLQPPPTPPSTIAMSSINDKNAADTDREAA